MATQTDFRVNNGLVVGGNSFVTVVANTAGLPSTYPIGQWVLNTDTGTFETYYSNTAGSNWVVMSARAYFPFGDYGNTSTDYTALANEVAYLNVYDCSVNPVAGLATYDLNA
jgi:hypothetical protein